MVPDLRLIVRYQRLSFLHTSTIDDEAPTTKINDPLGITKTLKVRIYGETDRAGRGALRLSSHDAMIGGSKLSFQCISIYQHYIFSFEVYK